ncbi:MAG: hypothetical protein ABII68_00780 [Pseudomonadota bacterium]
MNRKQYALIVLIALIGGIIGGTASTQIVIGKYAFAQNNISSQKVVKARGFEVIDKDGKILATLKRNKNGFPGLWLYNLNGKMLAELTTDPWKDTGQFRKPIGTHLWLINADNYDNYSITLDTDTMNFGISLKHGDASAGLDDQNIFLADKHNGGMQFNVYSNTLSLKGKKPNIILKDENDNVRAILGSTELKYTKSGTVEMRSPASAVLFGEDGKVIWSAP